MTAPCHVLNSIGLALPGLQQKEREMDALWLKFGQAVRAQRKLVKYPTGKLAKRLKISTTMLCFLENGKRRWAPEMAEKVVSLLNRDDRFPDVAPRKYESPYKRRKREVFVD